MQRLLAIDGDSQELSFVVASAVGEQMTLEAAGTIPATHASDNSPLPPGELGKALLAALGKFKRSGTKVLLGVERSAVELFKFPVPPTSDSELAELVANQVATESPTAADDSVIDFTVSAGPATESRKVTAAACTRAQVQRLNDLCSAAGITAQRMLMRPYAIASLFRKLRPDVNVTTLTVAVSHLDVDLVVVEQSQAVFFRSVKLPVGTADEAGLQRLLQEIRRTLLVAPQSGDILHPIKQVTVFGTSAALQEVAQTLAADSSITAEAIDPQQHFEADSQWDAAVADRYVPLLGMLVAETAGGKHPIDFLQPKKAAPPVNHRRRIITAAVAALVLIGAGQYLISERLGAADAENKRLADELKDVEKLIKKTAEKRQIAESIAEWDTNSILWLDELRNLAVTLPSGQDLVLQRLNASTGRAGKGSISFQGFASTPQRISEMEASVRNERHEVQTPRVEERGQDKAYPWSFETAISIAAAKPAVEVAHDDEQPRKKRQR